MLAGGIIASKWFVKMEGTMNEQSIALKLDDVEFRRPQARNSHQS